MVGTKVRLIGRRKKRGLVMIKPPGQLLRCRILEIYDRGFVSIQQREIEKVSRAVQQTSVVNFSFAVNTVGVEARKGRGRGDAVETVAVIKNAKFHKFHWLKRVGNSSNARVFWQRPT